MKLPGKRNKVASIVVIGLLSLLASCAQQGAPESSVMRDEDVAIAGTTSLAFGCRRIAWSSDGNFHDRDDMGASALAVALLAEKGQQKRLVH